MTIKAPITTTLDVRLKELFDQTKSIHGKDMSSILNESVADFLKEYCPIEIFDLEIQQKEQELQELRKTKDEAIYAYEARQKELQKQKKVEVETDSFLDDLRNKKFSKNIDAVLKQLQAGRPPNWKNLAPLYQFASERDMKEWFFAKMNEEGITV